MAVTRSKMPRARGVVSAGSIRSGDEHARVRGSRPTATARGWATIQATDERSGARRATSAAHQATASTTRPQRAMAPSRCRRGRPALRCARWPTPPPPRSRTRPRRGRLRARGWSARRRATPRPPRAPTRPSAPDATQSARRDERGQRPARHRAAGPAADAANRSRPPASPRTRRSRGGADRRRPGENRQGPRGASANRRGISPRPLAHCALVWSRCRMQASSERGKRKGERKDHGNGEGLRASGSVALGVWLTARGAMVRAEPGRSPRSERSAPSRRPPRCEARPASRPFR